MKRSQLERVKLSYNPAPGRTEGERAYIHRRLITIADELDYHLSNTLLTQPKWLPEAVITPETEAMYIESREAFESADRDEDGYIAGQSLGDQRASNRVRVASWYRAGNGDLFMAALIIVSPLPSEEWGALPLTLSHWRVVIPSMVSTHLHWKWIHAVRKYWNDEDYEVGGTFGWYMEPCKQLTKDDSQLWTGQAIYSHVVRQYLGHVSGT